MRLASTVYSQHAFWPAHNTSKIGTQQKGYQFVCIGESLGFSVHISENDLMLAFCSNLVRVCCSIALRKINEKGVILKSSLKKVEIR